MKVKLIYNDMYLLPKIVIILASTLCFHFLHDDDILIDNLLYDIPEEITPDYVPVCHLKEM